MKKVLGVIALLVVLAAPAMADYAVNPITAAVSTAAGSTKASWNDITGILTVAVYYTGPGAQGGLFVNGFAGEMSLYGTAASLFTPVYPTFANAAAVQTLITNTVGGTYALSGLTGVVQSMNYGDGATSFEVQSTATTPPANETVNSGALVAGNILGTFQFSYAGTEKSMTDAKLTLLPQLTVLAGAGAYDPSDLTDLAASFIGGPIPGTGPAPSGNANTIPVEVTNNNVSLDGTGNDANDLLLVPEPTTMGLLGLGLVGLVVRRKKA